MNYIRKISVLFAVFSLAGCGEDFLGDRSVKQPFDRKNSDRTISALQKADRFELLSLDPTRQEKNLEDGFHGWKILGKTQISNAATHDKLIAALNKGIAENQGGIPSCFNPRHGVRVINEGTSVDLVICFECNHALVYFSDREQQLFPTIKLSQTEFDRSLRAAGVPLAEDAKK